MNQERLSYLFRRYTGRTATMAERAAFLEAVCDPLQKSAVLQLIDAEMERLDTAEIETGEQDLSPQKAASLFEEIVRAGEEELSTVPVVKMRPIGRMMAAASVIFLLGIGSYFIFFNQKEKAVVVTPVRKELPGDVEPPQANRAMITLADGRTIYLDSVADGMLSMQDDVRLMKTGNGKIIYRDDSRSPSATSHSPVYNTLTNPRGSKVIDMMLSDGSHVWLNAGSSLKYPVAFAGNERNVEITGEAYFEVAPDDAKPFYVNKGETRVKVLGTHFNVNAYDDEENVKVTLLEGSVEVALHSAQGEKAKVRIKPGEQAVAHGAASLGINHSPNVEAVMAWKNGRFLFDKVTIESIMREAARWYDVEVEIREKITEEFGGSVPRNVNISRLLQLLELTDHVRFVVEGKKVMVYAR